MPFSRSEITAASARLGRVSRRDCPAFRGWGAGTAGGGLYLEVMPAGSKAWRIKYRFHGTEKYLSFGLWPALSLQEARPHREVVKACRPSLRRAKRESKRFFRATNGEFCGRPDKHPYQLFLQLERSNTAPRRRVGL